MKKTQSPPAHDVLIAYEAVMRRDEPESLLDEYHRKKREREHGPSSIRVGLEASDRMQIALDKTLGVGPKVHSDIQAFDGLRDAYVRMTGDSAVTGYQPRAQGMAREAIVASDFPLLLGNSINKLLLKDYAEADYGETMIISQPYINLLNFKPHQGIQVGYFGDLSTVDPETGDYLEAQKPGEVATTADVRQTGDILTVTRKAILSDDLKGITRRVERWGRAARRTFARYVWKNFIDNSTYTGDGGAWFSVGHGNLSTDVLGFAGVSAAIELLAAMTEPDSGEKLGLSTRSINRLTLVVPDALRATAFKINQATYVDAALAPNDLHHIFGANNERVLVNPLLTDTTDWGLFRDPTEVDIIKAGFMFDNRDPEIYLADNPSEGQMLVADKLRYKIRHEYLCYVADFRGAVKSVNP